MSDLVLGGTDLYPKTSVREQCGAGTYQNADLSLRYHSTGRQETDPAVHQPDHTNDQDDQPDPNDRCCRGVEGGTADYRGKPDVQPECSVWNLSDRIFHCILSHAGQSVCLQNIWKGNGGDLSWNRHCYL